MSLEFAVERFRNDLVHWYAVHQRDLPWRRTGDPYAIWVSEIMLQQTRVAAVIPYYAKFIQRFPDYHALASAPEPELLAHWAGLGYYYRARNLQKAAKAMSASGSSPATHESIRVLPGIGDYTSAAIASIAFGLAHAVLDGNVFRVLSRVANDSTNIAAGVGRKHFAALADQLLDRKRPGMFNQAMMELGATICLPKNPQCLVCPVAQLCGARQHGTQNDLPVKIVRPKTVIEERLLFWIEQEDKLLVWQRSADSRLMPGFWELPETTQLPAVLVGRKLGSFRHGITFHDYRFEVWEAEQPAALATCHWVCFSELNHLPCSTILKKARRLVEQFRRTAKIALSAAASA